MKVLVIGGGAREHALVARLSADSSVDETRLRPGQPGHCQRCPKVVAVDLADPDAMLALAEREQIDLTVVGPELPLSLGVADRFAAAGRLLFGPSAAAARLESSKAFAKAFMARHGVPDRPLQHLRRCRRARWRACVRASSAFRSCSRPTASPPARAS